MTRHEITFAFRTIILSLGILHYDYPTERFVEILTDDRRRPNIDN